VKRICSSLCLLSLPLFLAPFASAQSSFDVNLGFGTAQDGSNGAGIDNAASSNAFGSCVFGSGDTFCQKAPGLSGFFLGIGGDLMIQKRFGIGAEVNLQPAQSNYGPLQYRQTFYDVNGIYAPINQKRVALQLQGGIGAARTSFSVTQTSCLGTVACSSYNQPITSANHFQVHVGVGVQYFLTEHLFIRPQFDLHYVPGLTQQFSSDAVPEGTIWLGYSFGER
jgi:opacity protein-like surface antigen